MKAGDLVEFTPIVSAWGRVGLITDIRLTEAGVGQITVSTKISPQCTIPWINRSMYIEKVISEKR